MNCPNCNWWCEPKDTEEKCVFQGNYYVPPEYAAIWAKYECPECLHTWQTDGEELN